MTTSRSSTEASRQWTSSTLITPTGIRRPTRPIRSAPPAWNGWDARSRSIWKPKTKENANLAAGKPNGGPAAQLLRGPDQAHPRAQGRGGRRDPHGHGLARPAAAAVYR